MTSSEVCKLLRNKDIKEIYYNEQPVWIQEVHGNMAKVGFLNSGVSKDLFVDDLYEKNLYN